MQSKHKQTNFELCGHSIQTSYGLQLFSVGITVLNQRIIQKDDIEFVTEFPCLLYVEDINRFKKTKIHTVTIFINTCDSF